MTILLQILPAVLCRRPSAAARPSCLLPPSVASSWHPEGQRARPGPSRGLPEEAASSRNKGRPLFPFIKRLLRLSGVGGPAAASLASFTPVRAFAAEALAGGAGKQLDFVCQELCRAFRIWARRSARSRRGWSARCSIFLEGEGLECREYQVLTSVVNS